MSPRQEAHREAVRLDIASVARNLQDVLGQKIVAYAVGLADGRIIGKYARNEVQPSQKTETRLRDLYIITQILSSREDPPTVRAWMLGAHPLLEDRAPVELLHEENAAPVERTADAEIRRSFQSVVAVAEAFVAG